MCFWKKLCLYFKYISMIISYVTSILIGILAHRRGRNGIIMGGLALILISMLGLAMINISFIWNFIYKYRINSHLISSSIIGGGFYTFLNQKKE